MVKKYILSSISIMLLIYLQLLLIFGISYIELLPKTKIILLSITSIILVIISLKLYFGKTAKIYNIGVILTILLNIVTINYISNLNKEYNYLENIITNDYKYVNYNIYVQKKNTTYSDISKLSGKKIGVLTNKENISIHLNNKTNIECIKYKNIEEINTAISKGEIQSFIISDQEKELLKQCPELNNKTRIIYQNKIKDTI